MVQIFIDTKIQTKELNRALKQLQLDIRKAGTETIKSNATVDLTLKKGNTLSLTESLKQSAKNVGGTGFFVLDPKVTLIKQKRKKSGKQEWVLDSEQIETKKGTVILPLINKKFKSKDQALKFFNKTVASNIVKFLRMEMKKKSKKKLIPGVSSLGKILTIVVIDETAGAGIDATNAAVLARATGLAKKKKQVAQRGKLISAAQFSAILRTRISASSPHGPVGGSPLSSTQLTHRTQRYLKSIRTTSLRANAGQVIKSAKDRLRIHYTYHPLYTVHESRVAQGRRAPSRKIEKTIRQIVRGLFGANIKVEVIRDN